MFEVFNASATATASSSALLSGKTYTITQSAQADGVSTISNADAIKEARQNAQTLADQAVTDYTNLVINCNSKEINWTSYDYTEFKTSDGAILYFYSQKAKKVAKGNLLFLPGWSSSPDVFSPLINDNTNFTDNYNIYLLTQRGYNLQPQNNGNDIARYAADTKNFIESKNLTDLITISHSMGCSTLWYFIGLYGEKYFKGSVFIDQSPVLLINPRNTEKENLEYGSIFNTEQLFSITNTLIYEDKKTGDELKIALYSTFFTPEFKLTKPDIVQNVYDGIINYNNISSGQVVFNHVCINYSNDVLSNGINNPALLIGGTYSVVPEESKSIIYEKQFFKNSQLRILDREQGGSHLMFIENAPLVNEYINHFFQKYNL